jgi:hypothetical protein
MHKLLITSSEIKTRTYTITTNMNAAKKYILYVIYLKVWPIHGHVHTMCIGPPFQIFLMVCIVYCMIEFIIDLRKTVTEKHI